MLKILLYRVIILVHNNFYDFLSLASFSVYLTVSPYRNPLKYNDDSTEFSTRFTCSLFLTSVIQILENCNGSAGVVSFHAN